jgi:hypothetical protein
MQVWSGRVLWVNGGMKKFDTEGNLIDPGVRKQLEKYLQGFTGFVQQMQRNT